MTSLRYEIWVAEHVNAQEDALSGIAARHPTPRLLRRLLSGTIALTSTMSAAVAVPLQSDLTYPSHWYDLIPVGCFRIRGSDSAYIHTCEPGVTPAGTGAHATVDTQGRTDIDPNDGVIQVPLTAGGSFAVVQAAPFT